MKDRLSLFALLPILTAAVVLSGCSKRASSPAESAEATGQQSFASPEAAVESLVKAVHQNDTPALRELLGPGSAGLVSSGDAVSDRKERDSFLGRYRDYHELAAGGPDRLVLLVGQDRWPLPIPLVRTETGWCFDGDAGVKELLLRRIGANELRTINVMESVVAAEQEYAASGHDGDASGAYAGRVRSDPGKQNGLYWQVAPGQPESPAGPLLADAASEGYAGGEAARAPYHGYVYRMLTSQGPAAEGGARDYQSGGKLTGGFALLAYPATYGASGVMTFMVNQDGVVWQRDLGKTTADAAAAIHQFNPDDSWTPLAE
jgi:hypothetical protein